MLTDITQAAHRARDTFVQDTAGVAALVVILLVGLHLPGV